MKEKLDFLLKRNEKLGVAPIMLVFLGLVIVFAALYFLVFNKTEDDLVVDDTAGTEETADAEKGFFGKILGIFSSEEIANEPDLTVPSPPIVSEDSLILDEELLKAADKDIAEEGLIEIEYDDFQLNEVDTESVGRRDPMRSLVGENVGSFDKDRINNDAADMKDESQNYFGGVTIDDILLNEIKIDEIGRLRGEFIINGSLVPNLEVGDYLLELYYIKEFNLNGNYVTMQYKEDTYKLSTKNISGGKTYPSEGFGDIRK